MEIAEEWRPVEGYEHVYAVSSYGRVMRTGKGKSTYPGRILKPMLGDWGYLTVRLRDNGHDRMFCVHRLVAVAFIGPIPEGHEVNHIDGCKTHNGAGNLEYVTRKQNIRHAFDTGLAHGTRHIGEANPAAKFTEDDIRGIRAEYAANRHAAYRLAKQYGVTYRTVWLIVHGRTWQHVV